jgi:hypothetical protein
MLMSTSAFSAAISSSSPYLGIGVRGSTITPVTTSIHVAPSWTSH